MLAITAEADDLAYVCEENRGAAEALLAIVIVPLLGASYREAEGAAVTLRHLFIALAALIRAPTKIVNMAGFNSLGCINQYIVGGFLQLFYSQPARPTDYFKNQSPQWGRIYETAPTYTFESDHVRTLYFRTLLSDAILDVNEQIRLLAVPRFNLAAATALPTYENFLPSAEDSNNKRARES